MHAQQARIWLLGALGALALGGIAGLLTAGGADVDPYVHLALLTVGASFLAVALSLGLLPAFARRDWPAPLHAIAALGVAALGPMLYAFTQDLRHLTAPLGVALILAAAHPLALVLQGTRWKTGESLLAAGNPFRPTDSVALASLSVSLAGAGAGGVLLVTLPRGLPNAALVVLLLSCALPAALGALLFVLPREARAPLRGATLAGAALVVLALAALTLALAFAFPLQSDFFWPSVGVVLALTFGILTLRRVAPPAHARPLLRATLALAVLAGIVLVLATLGGKPSRLAGLALHAQLVFALALLVAALQVGARLMLPGQPKGARWWKWTSALAIAGLFLLAPAYQYPRSPFPGALVLAVALALAVAGLMPLASSARPAMRTR